MEKKTIHKVDDIIAWQKAKQLALLMYKITNNDKFSKDFGLKDQIRRASVSIVSNIAEGYGRGGNKEFMQFLYIANGSLNELYTQFIIAVELNYISKEESETILPQINDCFKLTGSFINYMKNSEYKGSKFKEPEEQYGFSVDQLLSED